jgi:hypothetical protein
LSSPVLCSRDAEQGVWVVINFLFIFFSSIAGQLQTPMALWRRFKRKKGVKKMDVLSFYDI